MACVIGNADNEFVPALTGDLGRRLSQVWPDPGDLTWPQPQTVTSYGGFAGVHHLLFEQSADPLPGFVSPRVTTPPQHHPDPLDARGETEPTQP